MSSKRIKKELADLGMYVLLKLLYRRVDPVTTICFGLPYFVNIRFMHRWYWCTSNDKL